MMKAWADGLDEIEPAAIIFHISRCGSTLISQLLATSEENVVLAEVPFFDDLLRLPFKEPGISEAMINELFLCAVKYYGQNCAEPKGFVRGSQKRVFIKADRWHLFFYKQLR